MPPQQFNAPVENVADVVHIHHNWLDTAPPDDPAVSVQCGQCRRLTWRYTRHCVHCQLDLVRWRRVHRVRAVLQGQRMTRLFVLASGVALLAALVVHARPASAQGVVYRCGESKAVYTDAITLPQAAEMGCTTLDGAPAKAVLESIERQRAAEAKARTAKAKPRPLAASKAASAP